MKRQPSGWEKTFANHIRDQGRIVGLYEELAQLNTKKKLHFQDGQGVRADSSPQKRHKWSIAQKRVLSVVGSVCVCVCVCVCTCVFMCVQEIFVSSPFR